MRRRKKKKEEERRRKREKERKPQQPKVCERERERERERARESNCVRTQLNEEPKHLGEETKGQGRSPSPTSSSSIRFGSFILFSPFFLGFVDDNGTYQEPIGD